MSKQRVETYEWVCESCKSVALVNGRYNFPVGWGKITHHDCGLTGYSYDADACPTCLAKHKASKHSGKF